VLPSFVLSSSAHRSRTALTRRALALVAAAASTSFTAAAAGPPASVRSGAPVAPFSLPRPDVLQKGSGSWQQFPVVWFDGFGQSISGITAGSDGNMWFVNGRPAPSRSGPGLIFSSMGMDGSTSQSYLLVGSGQFAASSIVSGPDGRLYMGGTFFVPDGSFCTFSQPACAAILASDTGRNFSLYFLSTGRAIPSALVAGPDHNIWFVTGAAIGSITTSGAEREHRFKGADRTIGDIAVGSDGRVWFDESTAPTDANLLAAIDPTTGKIRRYPVRGCRNIGGGLALASDGNLYVSCTNLVGSQTAYSLLRISPKGAMTHIARGGSGGPSGTHGLVAGPDGAIWFAANDAAGGHALVRYDPASGNFKRRELPFTSAIPQNLALGPDGNIWITDAVSTFRRTHVYVFVLNTLSVQPPSLTLSIGASQALTASYSGSLGLSSLSAATSNPSVATVSAGSGPGSFIVKGVASGTATITVADPIGNSVRVPVSVH
jgi:streptogramin lyase